MLLTPIRDEVLFIKLILTKYKKRVNMPITDCVGVIAQMGERRVRNAKVRGSIPLDSTKKCSGLGV